MAAIIADPLAGVLAIAGGMLAGLIWLWFWLKEDCHPEPRKIIILTFVIGTIGVPIAFFFEELSFYFGRNLGFWPNGSPTFILLIIWAVIEETIKYCAAYFAAFRRKFFDEPIDAPIYLVTAALGFAAMENIFMLSNIFQKEILGGLATINLRFIGATLLHIVASAVVGLSIGYDFFHPRHRIRNALGGLALASLLHGLFNFFILKGGSENIIYVFSVVWLGVIVVILSMEKIKKLQINN
jgi:protease PrsW